MSRSQLLTCGQTVSPYDSALKRKAFRYDEELLERTHDALNDQ
jgi:hypothetical protein